jgi:hypothetical protein
VGRTGLGQARGLFTCREAARLSSRHVCVYLIHALCSAFSLYKPFVHFPFSLSLSISFSLNVSSNSIPAHHTNTNGTLCNHQVLSSCHTLLFHLSCTTDVHHNNISLLLPQLSLSLSTRALSRHRLLQCIHPSLNSCCCSCLSCLHLQCCTVSTPSAPHAMVVQLQTTSTLDRCILALVQLAIWFD